MKASIKICRRIFCINQIVKKRDGISRPKSRYFSDANKPDESVIGNKVIKGEEKETTVSTSEAIAQATKHYTHEINRAYSDMEKILMARIRESNQRRFRVILLSVTLVIFWVLAFFGRHLRKLLSEQTAGIARETLENESLKIQTQELATAVVQTILNDKDVTAHAATFLRDASGAQETQEALLKLTLHVLQHPRSIDELSVLVKKVLDFLSTDQVLYSTAITVPDNSFK